MSFPSLGDIIKYLFDSTGVLPLSGNKNLVFLSEKEKKSFQTSLRRLAKESHELENNFCTAIDIFLRYISEISPSEKVSHVVTATIEDCYWQYKDLVLREGTYLNTRDTIRWVLQSRLIDRISLSLQKNYHKFNLHNQSFEFPDEEYWFLPSMEESEDVSWPISKAFNWVYEITGTTRTRFHFPEKDINRSCYTEKDTKNNDNRLEQNLENAYHWAAGKPSRSWSEINNNLEQSFKALEVCQIPEHQRVIDAKTKQKIKFLIFVARFSTSVWQDIHKVYGREFLGNCISQYVSRNSELKALHEPFVRNIKEVISSYLITDDVRLDRLWFVKTTDFWEQESAKIIRFAEKVSSYYQSYLIEHGLDSEFPADIKARWYDEIGPYVVNAMLEQAKYTLGYMPSENFKEYLHKGLDLKSYQKTTLSEAVKYKDDVGAEQLMEQLGWLGAWVCACVHYRNGDYAKAYAEYDEAFSKGKYKAGQYQYKLVNQYIEACAKLDKWKEFKKGVAWATYLGIEVRWLRGAPESEDSLKLAFEIMKKAVYPVL